MAWCIRPISIENGGRNEPIWTVLERGFHAVGGHKDDGLFFVAFAVQHFLDQRPKNSIRERLINLRLQLFEQLRDDAVNRRRVHFRGPRRRRVRSLRGRFFFIWFARNSGVSRGNFCGSRRRFFRRGLSGTCYLLQRFSDVRKFFVRFVRGDFRIARSVGHFECGSNLRRRREGNCFGGGGGPGGLTRAYRIQAPIVPRRRSFVRRRYFIPVLFFTPR